jgi:hypothetical protein
VFWRDQQQLAGWLLLQPTAPDQTIFRILKREWEEIYHNHLAATMGMGGAYPSFKIKVRLRHKEGKMMRLRIEILFLG